jgi:DNA-binding NarL/FixJ family response regulator
MFKASSNKLFYFVMPVKIIIADDHQMFIDGVKLILNQENNIEIIGEANNGQKLLHLLQLQKPDVLLLDVNMPKMDGVEVMQVIKNHFSDLKVIIISTYLDYELITNLKKLGIRGYLSKTATSEELKQAIFDVFEGNEHFSAQVQKALKEHYEDNNKYDNFVQKFKISSREAEILRLIIKGHTNEEIADKIHLSKNTVDGYRKELLKKLNVRNTAELVKLAYENNFV